MTGPAPAVDLLADEPPEEEIVDDGGTGSGDVDRPARAWRGPSPVRWVLFGVVAVAVLVLDQATKAWLVATLPNPGDQRVIIERWLNIVHGQNSGALFGLLPQSAPVFAIVSLGVVALIVVYHRRAGRGYLTTIALGLLLGGAIGNLLDRLEFGYVVDWIDMGIGSWRFFTYNVADAAITTAIVLLIGMAVVPRLAEWGADG
jgi:signal peptidase II